MPEFTDDQKRARKHTAKVKSQLQELDRITPPTPPGIVVYHPRWHNKPMRCQMGLHEWKNDVIMGIPHLTCSKCGATTVKGIHEGNYTAREIIAKCAPKPIPKVGTKAWYEAAYRRLNHNDRR
jgi:hypothetical protein